MVSLDQVMKRISLAFLLAGGVSSLSCKTLASKEGRDDIRPRSYYSVVGSYSETPRAIVGDSIIGSLPAADRNYRESSDIGYGGESYGSGGSGSGGGSYNMGYKTANDFDRNIETWDHGAKKAYSYKYFDQGDEERKEHLKEIKELEGEEKYKERLVKK